MRQERGGLLLGKDLMACGKCLVDMVYCLVTVDMVIDMLYGRYLLVQFSAVFTMLTAECIVLPSVPSPHTTQTQPPLGTYHQNTFVTPSYPVKSDAASYCWLERKPWHDEMLIYFCV